MDNILALQKSAANPRLVVGPEGQRFFCFLFSFSGVGATALAEEVHKGRRGGGDKEKSSKLALVTLRNKSKQQKETFWSKLVNAPSLT